VDPRATCAEDHDAPTRPATLYRREADLRAFLDKMSIEIAAGSLVRATGQGPVSRQVDSGAWLHDELALCIERGERGDATSARRAAELLELLDQDAPAAVWWHRAADLGDEDAVDYVQEILRH